MEKLNTKGLEILTFKDGTKHYKPFAIFWDENKINTFPQTYYVEFHWAGYAYYTLGINGFYATEDKVKAQKLLDEAIEERNKYIQQRENKTVVNKEIIYLD